MENPNNTNIFPITHVPRLFISERLTPHSTSELTSLNIRHILCISRPQDVPKFKFPDSTSNSRHYFLIRQIEVSDTSTEDVLCHLKKACSWIDSKLQPSTNPKDGNVLESSGVLIHCPQGIRRAGTCAVAFVMQKFSMSYSAALALVRESHPSISPNPGFELQLRIWSHCDHDVLTSSNTVGKPVGEEKPAYKAWKRYRDSLLGKGEDSAIKARVATMAKVAADLATRKAEKAAELKIGKKSGENDSSDDTLEGKMWERLEEMEAKWTRRLISGESPDL